MLDQLHSALCKATHHNWVHFQDMIDLDYGDCGITINSSLSIMWWGKGRFQVAAQCHSALDNGKYRASNVCHSFNARDKNQALIVATKLCQEYEKLSGY